jgi:GntR family transcriptional regulator, transcriptional repressor for pyruvate dehydrogenase complex
MNTPFSKIERPTTLSQVIVDNVEQSIRQRKLVPGQRLPTEQELCAMFSVSRTAVREALRMLSARGLITIKKRRGMFVSDMSTSHATSAMGLILELRFDKDYILHVFNVRKTIEPEVCRWAAQNRTPDDLAILRKNLEQMEACDPEDRDVESTLDQGFHSTIAAASKNPIVPVVLEPIFALMPKIRSMVYGNIVDCKSSALDCHRGIFRAIEQRDGGQACQLMSDHISRAARQANEAIDRINSTAHASSRSEKVPA